MSEENVELVRRLYERFNARDEEGLMELVAPDARFHFIDWGPFPQRDYTGWEETRAFWDDIFSAFPNIRMEPTELVSEGDFVVATIENTGQGGGSGISVDMRTGVLAELQHGQLVRLEVFKTRREALEAVGLSE